MGIRGEVFSTKTSTGKRTYFFNIKENLDEAVSFFAARGEEGKGTIFPRIFKCPICSKKLKASKPGRFRCSECKTILAIDNAGQVFLG